MFCAKLYIYVCSSNCQPSSMLSNLMYMSYIPTSEVRSASTKDHSSDQYLAALKAHNRNLMEIFKAIQTPGHQFHPDCAEANASSWFTSVDLIFTDNVLEGSALIISLSKALEGSASLWLSQIFFAGITWTQFKKQFIQRL